MWGELAAGEPVGALGVLVAPAGFLESLQLFQTTAKQARGKCASRGDDESPAPWPQRATRPGPGGRREPSETVLLRHRDRDRDRGQVLVSSFDAHAGLFPSRGASKTPVCILLQETSRGSWEPQEAAERGEGVAGPAPGRSLQTQ